MAAYTNARLATDPTFVEGRVSSNFITGVLPGVIYANAIPQPSPLQPSLPARTTYPYVQPAYTTTPKTP